jgi:hypothetical protein
MASLRKDWDTGEDYVELALRVDGDPAAVVGCHEEFLAAWIQTTPRKQRSAFHLRGRRESLTGSRPAPATESAQ